MAGGDSHAFRQAPAALVVHVVALHDEQAADKQGQARYKTMWTSAKLHRIYGASEIGRDDPVRATSRASRRVNAAEPVLSSCTA